MDTGEIAREIYAYTDGYPFLVSRLCKIIDEKLDKDWTIGGVRAAVEIILEENNTLFDDLIKNIENNPELYDFVYSMLMRGVKFPFNVNDPIMRLGAMYGFFKKRNRMVAISNKIFEILITEYFVSIEMRNQYRYY